MIQMAALMAGWPARLGFFVAGVAALVGLRAYDVSKQQAIGADKVVAKIEKATENATKLGSSAAGKSTASSVRGLRDPTARDN